MQGVFSISEDTLFAANVSIQVCVCNSCQIDRNSVFLVEKAVDLDIRTGNQRTSKEDRGYVYDDNNRHLHTANHPGNLDIMDNDTNSKLITV